MDSSLDVLCACAMLIVVVAVTATYGVTSSGRRAAAWGAREGFEGTPRRTALPPAASAIALWALSPVVRATVAVGVSANTVTAISLMSGAGAGILFACGHFGVAALLFVIASLGDALDGLVARTTRTESAAGALLDACVDRYGEFFAFGGLALFFRSSGPLLTLILLALAGSFMVSYGSTKAEGLGVMVPGGIMRRAERATCLGVGATLAPLAGALSQKLGGPPRADEVPVVLAVAVIGILANLSAVRRLREIATAVARTAPEVANPAERAVHRPAMDADARVERGITHEL